ncbi:FxsA family protein [Saccharopolyspora thermophila]|uniref:FxsA family protein n=1 Tax=Saccharopolyspora thermophila TaxID=89367 RepID=A0ABP3M6U6_9PSEU
MPILVVLLVAGVVEIAVLIALGTVIGLLPTLGLLVAAAALGTWLLRREGRRTLQEFRDAARQRRAPDRELSDGVLIAAGGLLIILPGFVSDICGLICLFPPTRALLRTRILRAAERRSQQVQDQMWLHVQRAHRDRGATAPGSDVIDGEVVSVTEDDAAAPRSGPELLPPQRSAQAGYPDEQPRR